MTGTLPLHRVFLNKPLDLMNSLHCKVVVNSLRGTRVTGGLVAVDPVTDTAVLVDIGDSVDGDITDHSVSVVPFASWDTLEVIDRSEEYKERVRGMNSKVVRNSNLSKEECEAVRDKVIAWLSKNGLESVVRGDDLVIADAVILEPPYTSDCCNATNEIILGRVQALLERMH